MATAARYPFRNSLQGQGDRLGILETLLDPGTVEALQERGAAPGWACLEIGAGGGSIARWLARQVGDTGRVLATDLDLTAFRGGGVEYPNLTAAQHDVTTDPLPPATYDLVHARLVLSWLPHPSHTLARLVTSVKPGGWLVVEDLDFASTAPGPDMDPDLATLFTRVLDAHLTVLANDKGFDPAFGRRHLSLLRGAGLEDVVTAGHVSMWSSGEPGAELWRLTFEQLRQPMVDSGLVSDDDVDRAAELCLRGMSFLSPITMISWGRRPSD